MELLEVTDIDVSFGQFRALEGVSVRFQKEEIHAVLGGNGAGKSTLMNVLGGFLSPTLGVVRFDGTDITEQSASERRKLGIQMVHQHFMLVPEFTVAENLALSQISDLRSVVPSAALLEDAKKKAAEIGWEIPWNSRAESLPVGVQQRVEILKALCSNAKVLILDEPTAVLAPAEVDDLFRVIRDLKNSGVCVILIAHKLSEIMRIADRVTVLRSGKLISTVSIQETSEAEIETWMIGEKWAPANASAAKNPGEIAFKAENLVVLSNEGFSAVNGISFELRRGSVLGIAGVDGNGQVELAEAIVGVRPLVGGNLTQMNSIGYIPQDRQEDGLALGMTIPENLFLGAMDQESLTKGPFLNIPAILSWTKSLVEKYDIKVGSVEDQARSLSGGNQQKVVISRALSQNPELIVAVSPTRGLDFHATRFVHDCLTKAAQNGAMVILLTSDVDELSLATETRFISRGQWSESLVGASA